MVSETFIALAQCARAVDPGGSGDFAQPTKLSITYDATTGAYTLASTGGTAAFVPAEMIASSGRPWADIYRRSANDLTEELLLTKPGDTGAFTYKYVGGGLWQRTEQANGVTRADWNGFIYGIRTPDAEIPRSGTASYSIDLAGFESLSARLIPFIGSGLATLNFDQGRWTTKALTQFRLGQPGDYGLLSWGQFSAEGLLGRGHNSFIGSFKLFSFHQFNGSIEGGFFGPGAAEIGASFGGSAANTDRQVAGFLVGRPGEAPAELETLRNLTDRTLLSRTVADMIYTRNPDGTHTDVRLQSFGTSTVSLDLQEGIIKFPFSDLGESNRVAALSDARFTTYRVMEAGRDTTFRVFNPSDLNDQIALTYTTFALENRLVWAETRAIDVAHVYGIQTAHFALPRTGTGSYSGVLHGSAIGSGDAADHYLLTGTAGFVFDWAGGTFTGSLSPVAANQRTSESFVLGTYTFANGSFAGPQGMSNTFISDINGLPGTVGRLFGNFYGPNAQEVGAVFNLTTPGAGTVLVGSGAIVAKRSQ